MKRTVRLRELIAGLPAYTSPARLRKSIVCIPTVEFSLALRRDRRRATCPPFAI